MCACVHSRIYTHTHAQTHMHILRGCWELIKLCLDTVLTNEHTLLKWTAAQDCPGAVGGEGLQGFALNFQSHYPSLPHPIKLPAVTEWPLLAALPTLDGFLSSELWGQIAHLLELCAIWILATSPDWGPTGSRLDLRWGRLGSHPKERIIYLFDKYLPSTY